MLVPGFIKDFDRSALRIIELKSPEVCLDVTVARNRNNQNPSIPHFNEQLSLINNATHFGNHGVEKLRLVQTAVTN